MTEKATDYLKAGILQVWVVDTKAKTITVFALSSLPVTYRENQVIKDDLLPKLEITPNAIFQRAGLIPSTKFVDIDNAKKHRVTMILGVSDSYFYQINGINRALDCWY